MTKPFHAEATIELLTAEAGGRRSAAFQGYRPQFFYHGSDWDAAHHYPDVEKVEPGESARVFLRFASPEAHHGQIYEGTPFLCREGAHTVAFGVITEVLEQLSLDAAEHRGANPSG